MEQQGVMKKISKHICGKKKLFQCGYKNAELKVFVSKWALFQIATIGLCV